MKHGTPAKRCGRGHAGLGGPGRAVAARSSTRGTEDDRYVTHADVCPGETPGPGSDPLSQQAPVPPSLRTGAPPGHDARGRPIPTLSDRSEARALLARIGEVPARARALVARTLHLRGPSRPRSPRPRRAHGVPHMATGRGLLAKVEALALRTPGPAATLLLGGVLQRDGSEGHGACSRDVKSPGRDTCTRSTAGRFVRTISRLRCAGGAAVAGTRRTGILQRTGRHRDAFTGVPEPGASGHR